MFMIEILSKFYTFAEKYIFNMDNKTFIRKVFLFYGISFLITLLITVVPLFIKFEYYGFVSLSGGLLFVLFFLTNIFGGYYYIEIEVENNSILKLKHYKLVPYGRKFEMFQIQLKRLCKIEVKDYLFGLFTFVHVYEQSKKGISRYPKLGFSAFSPADKKKAIGILNRLVGVK